jgi:hypothetical protein
VGLDFCQQSAQFVAVKLPLKRSWGLVGKFFIQGQSQPDCVQIGKIIGRQYLPLDDREVNFHLIEPTGSNSKFGIWLPLYEETELTCRHQPLKLEKVACLSS